LAIVFAVSTDHAAAWTFRSGGVRMKKSVVDKHHCQMDEAAGAIRSVCDAKKCCGKLTQRFVQYRKKYYLCLVHMATVALLSLGFVGGLDGNRI